MRKKTRKLLFFCLFVVEWELKFVSFGNISWKKYSLFTELISRQNFASSLVHQWTNFQELREISTTLSHTSCRRAAYLNKVQHDVVQQTTNIYFRNFKNWIKTQNNFFYFKILTKADFYFINIIISWVKLSFSIYEVL